MSSTADKIAKKRAKDLEDYKQQQAKRREQAENAQSAGSGNESIVTEEPPLPPTSASTILTKAAITASTFEEPPPPPTSSSAILSSAVAASMEEGSEDKTLPPSVSSQHTEGERRKLTNSDMNAAIARKKADLNESDSPNSSNSGKRTKKTHVTFDSTFMNAPATPPRPTSSNVEHDPGSPNTTASSQYASTISSLTTDDFIERKRQTMDWPSVLPEEDDVQATGNEEGYEDHPNTVNATGAVVAANPPPSAPPVLAETTPVIHVEATPVFDDDYDENSDSGNHPKRKNPFKDWRVLVFIMIAISTIVGLTVGLVMNNMNSSNNSTSSAASPPPTAPEDDSGTDEKEITPSAAPRVVFSFSIELSTSDINSIDKDTLVNVTKAHMEEAMTGIVDSLDDIALNVTLQAGSDDGDKRKIDPYNSDIQNRRRMDVATAIFDAEVTLKDDSDIPPDESAFVNDVLSTSFSSNQRESLVESMKNAGLDVTALSSPVALVVVDNDVPSKAPTSFPSPSKLVTNAPAGIPTAILLRMPSNAPSKVPTSNPSRMPITNPPTPPPGSPTESPSASPSTSPSLSTLPSTQPTASPSASPSVSPTTSPSTNPTLQPSNSPSFISESASKALSTAAPTLSPTSLPSAIPSFTPTNKPSTSPSRNPTSAPSRLPTSNPTPKPSIPVDNTKSDTKSDTKSIQTSVHKKFSRSGAMFAVTSLVSSVTITGIDILMDVAMDDVGVGDIEIEVWTRNGGSFQTYARDEAEWTWRNNKQPYFISSEILKETGTGKKLEERIVSIEEGLFDPIVIPAGQTLSFYVTLRLQRGMVIGQSFFEDEDEYLKITSGTSNAYRFGAVNTPRNWNGALKYVLN